MFLLSVVLLFGIGFAEEYEGCEEYFVICDPDSYVNVREFPTRKQEPRYALYCGDKVYVDGKVRNGYWHIWGVSGESDEGWISPRYIDVWEPMDDVAGRYVVVGQGRVALREGIDGKRIDWVYPGEEVEVLAMSAKWAVVKKTLKKGCRKGFVKAEYLEEIADEKK